MLSDIIKKFNTLCNINLSISSYLIHKNNYIIITIIVENPLPTYLNICWRVIRVSWRCLPFFGRFGQVVSNEPGEFGPAFERHDLTCTGLWNAFEASLRCKSYRNTTASQQETNLFTKKKKS